MAALKVNLDLCIGCGLCVEICPDVFEIRENKARHIVPKLLKINEKQAIIKNTNPCDTCDCILVVDSCPVAAIIIEKS